ncbi:MAG: hypothetical protein HYU36_25285 [Planctomycetes bacterium]|nr:hypothetical protein [Planctomycetota bacterium]
METSGGLKQEIDIDPPATGQQDLDWRPWTKNDADTFGNPQGFALAPAIYTVTLKAIYGSGPASLVCTDTHEISVVQANLAVDSNNDGVVDAGDESFEVKKPGKVFGVNKDNDDYDREPVDQKEPDRTNDRFDGHQDREDFETVVLAFSPQDAPSATLKLKKSGSGKIRILRDDGQDGEVILGPDTPESVNIRQQFQNGTLVLAVEGVKPGQVDLELVYDTGSFVTSDSVILSVYDFQPVGAYKFGSVDQGTVIPLPGKFRRNLSATHLLIPADCQINESENRSFGLLRFEEQFHPEGTLLKEKGGAGRVCRQIEPNMYKDPVSLAFIAILNFFEQLFGGAGHLTPEQLFSALVAEYGIPGQEAQDGIWWESPPYTATGKQPALLLSTGAVEGKDETVILVKTPIQVTANQAPGTPPVPEGEPIEAAQFEVFELAIHLDDDYFHHLGSQQKGLAQSDRFDAYDADLNGEKIIVDLQFTLMSGGHDDHPVDKDGDGIAEIFNVPGFVMKETAYPHDAESFKWRARFTPPFATDGTEYWQADARAAVWHTYSGANDVGFNATNYDEFNSVQVSRGQRTKSTFYHYYGYNSFPAEIDTLPSLTGNQHRDNAFYQAQDPLGQKPYDDVLPVPRLKFRAGKALTPGFLVKPVPGKDNPLYFNQQVGQGGTSTTKAYFLLGLAKPWDRQYEPPNFMNADDWNVWAGADLVDRKSFLSEMKAKGMNFDYVWFAPWECQMVHQKAGSEFWYRDNSREEEAGIVPPEEWRGYSYYDQGRAARMDEIVRLHEENGIYMALNVWPHQSLQFFTHHWGETGWDQKRLDEEENGFSTLLLGQTRESAYDSLQPQARTGITI